MKDLKTIIEYYGKCCVSEYAIDHNNIYPVGKDGEELRKRDALKLADIAGQKKAIEYILST